MSDQKLSGLDLIAEERQRQIAKGFDSAHDDTHSGGELAAVAERLIHRVVVSESKASDPVDGTDQWHMFLLHKWGSDPDKLLVIAGALIVAEIERRQRSMAVIIGNLQRGLASLFAPGIPARLKHPHLGLAITEEEEAAMMKVVEDSWNVETDNDTPPKPKYREIAEIEKDKDAAFERGDWNAMANLRAEKLAAIAAERGA